MLLLYGNAHATWDAGGKLKLERQLESRCALRTAVLTCVCCVSKVRSEAY